MRGDLDDVARRLEELNLDAEKFVEMAERASDALNKQAFKQGALRQDAEAIAGYVRDVERNINELLEEAGGSRSGAAPVVLSVGLN